MCSACVIMCVTRKHVSASYTLEMTMVKLKQKETREFYDPFMPTHYIHKFLKSEKIITSFIALTSDFPRSLGKSLQC